jgi:hypothetical protein
MLNVVMLSVIMLNVVMINVVAPQKVTASFAHFGRRSINRNGSIYVASRRVPSRQFLSIFIRFNSDGLSSNVVPFSNDRVIAFQ